MMDQFSLYVDSITTQAEDLGKQVLVDQTTQEWLRLSRQGAAKEEIDSSMNQLRQNLSSIMINNSNAMSISVLLDDGTGSWEVIHRFMKQSGTRILLKITRTMLNHI